MERRLHLAPDEEGKILRVLVVDESRVLPWLVRRLAGNRIEVLEADCYRDALALVERHPVDAAIVSVTPAYLPWREFQCACARRRPAIPVLYESCLATSVEALGLAPVEGWAAVLAKPASRSELEGALELLLDAVAGARAAPEVGEEFHAAFPKSG